MSQKVYRFKNGYELIGYPFVPPTPFRPKDYERMDNPETPWPLQKNPSYIRVSEQSDRLLPIDPHVYLRERETIREDLNRLTKPINYKKAIYIMHSPPFGTKLDFIQGGKSAGSRSIKTFIEGNQPLLTLHGHIHESPGSPITFPNPGIGRSNYGHWRIARNSVTKTFPTTTSRLP